MHILRGGGKRLNQIVKCSIKFEISNKQLLEAEFINVITNANLLSTSTTLKVMDQTFNLEFERKTIKISLSAIKEVKAQQVNRYL